MIIAKTDAELFAAVKDGHKKIQVRSTATSSLSRVLSYAASQRSNKKILGIALIVVGVIVSVVLANVLGGSILATLSLVAVVAIVVAIIKNTYLGGFVRTCGQDFGPIGTVVGVLLVIGCFGYKFGPKLYKAFGSGGDFVEFLIVCLLHLLPLLPFLIFLFAGAYVLTNLPKEYNVIKKKNGSVWLIEKDDNEAGLSSETADASDGKPQEDAAVSPSSRIGSDTHPGF